MSNARRGETSFGHRNGGRAVVAVGLARDAAQASRLRDDGGTSGRQTAQPVARRPLALVTAWRAVLHYLLTSAVMLATRQLRWPRQNVGRVVRFADGTSATVYRETVAWHAPEDPCVLAVCFRLRGVRGRGHAWFRTESILNTPLFVGFPGFVSKLWLASDGTGRYRGLYEWDGVDRAERYARSLWRVLQLGCVSDSIDFRVFPGVTRDAVLAEPELLAGYDHDEHDPWWRILATAGAEATSTPDTRRPHCSHQAAPRVRRTTGADSS
jgi:hypothetical protein